MRLFELIRIEDVSGVSGVGKIAEGVEFDNKKVVIQWLTSYSTLEICDNIQVAEAIHGHGGRTIVKWL